MDNLRQLLHNPDCRGALLTAAGEVRLFRRHGVADLIALLEEAPSWLRGASVADRIVGCGAAYLFIKGGVKAVFAEVASRDALALLQHAGIATSYALRVPAILNRAADDLCPVEKLTAQAANAEEAYALIKQFVEQQRQKQ